MVFAGALLWAAAGCSLDAFLASVGPGGRTLYAAGSVDQVSASLKASLGNAGIELSESRNGTDVRLAGKTRSGKKFALVLKQQYAGGGQRTCVAVEWEDAADAEFWGLVGEVLVPRRVPKNTVTANPGPSAPDAPMGQ
jgi:hypothetical protein